MNLTKMSGGLNGSSMPWLMDQVSDAKSSLRDLEKTLLLLHPHPRDYITTDFSAARVEWESMAKSITHVREYLEALGNEVHDQLHR